MNDRDWLIWYRNWLCQEHQPAAISTHSVVDALDRQLGFFGSWAADQALADVGRATRDKAPHLNLQEINPPAGRGDRRKAQDARMGLCMICQQPFHGMQPCKTAEDIKPQAERDDRWTNRIDPYDDRIRVLERWMNLNTVDICDSQQPLVDPDLPHPYGAPFHDVMTKGTAAVRLSYKDGVMKTEHVPQESVYQRGSVVVDYNTPAAPTRAHADCCCLDTDHRGPCVGPSAARTGGGPYLTSADVWYIKDAPEPPVLFWRCKHYPIATHNWATREKCEHGCHNHSPTWDSNGESR